ncbi:MULTISPECIES: TetR/AcrR family transcriptional regulator [unclassified Micromonospora]|uniref:TetR/AcrR family transcriptional regulator n=1 Tax=unclassified Micromonospora TaxID=2617518 RepID=UPI001C24442B|nr:MULTISPECIES: TetR/AcrR family transcriptional regulator [unclassified Micromonospora]MBU8856487.1 TetR/AcrR family transcriptional regulator [Micromonospora sp. WMMB482]MDM4782099.1 TetR/AcrR family transcriptional regulator [Micromonospora sp. b486]
MGQSSRPALARDAIVAAALDLVGRRGVDAVSMRTIADAFGTGPASIYRHVAGKDELLDLALDRVLAEVRLPADGRDWRRALSELAGEVRAALLRHGDIASIAMSGRPVGGNSVRIAEALLATLRTAGFPDDVCAWALDRLSLYVTADALDTARRRLSERAGADSVARHWAVVAEHYRNLPAQDFPHTTAMGQMLFQGDPDLRFTLGLEVFLDGLAPRRRR